MSVALTSAPVRPDIIDLTRSSTVTPSPFASGPEDEPETGTDINDAVADAALTAGVTRWSQTPEELPTMFDEGLVVKKRRINDALRYVSQAVTSLPKDRFHVDDIAMEAIKTIVEEQDGILSQENHMEAVVRAESLVTQLSLQPKFHIHPEDFHPEETVSIGSPKLDWESKSANEVLQSLQEAESSEKLFTASSDSFKQEYPPEGELMLDAARPIRVNDTAQVPSSSWFHLRQRPYLNATDRALLVQEAKYLEKSDVDPIVFHVDFTQEEISTIFDCVSKHIPTKVPRTLPTLASLCQQYQIPTIVNDSIPLRTAEDVLNFCTDLLSGSVKPAGQGQVLKLEHNRDDYGHREGQRNGRVASLLLAREVEGNRGFGKMRQYENFQNGFRNAQEDGLVLVAEFTNCAGDIATTTWIPDNNILCGTTAHSDSHNQQYNKPGNLLLCSTSRGELRAFPDHRIPRPIVEKGENATDAMRQSQDPWLYASVVSSDYDHALGLAYTSSFDKTVKVWRIEPTGESMSALATFTFGGNVNFVAAAGDGSGRVAAAADVPSDAVRVYTINRDDVQESTYVSFSCSRTDADSSDKWAYYPATMQWGKAPGTQHILAVGYSPRSLAGDDRDIPEDKQKTGELVLWDAAKQRKMHVMTATTANFFEVVWHPTLPRFVAATTPSGLKVDYGVKTQIHLFRPDFTRDPTTTYGEYQKLDCYASDINELTFVSNSVRHAYVTAACTDGHVYVWDTAQGDKPIHVLKHGHPLDEFYEDREKEDTGVKFTTWGSSLDRFYTGGSDGVVNVWNVRNKHRPFVRTLLEAPAPISCGAFSPDLLKLVIGDATGRVFVFSLDKRDESRKHMTHVPALNRTVLRPLSFIPHPEPPPPQSPLVTDRGLNAMDVDAIETSSIAAVARQTYLTSQQLVIHPNPVIGAVQGPNYASSGLFCSSAHLDGDAMAPLLPPDERHQQESVRSSLGSRARSLRRLKPVTPTRKWMHYQHGVNQKGNVGIEMLLEGEKEKLIQERCELEYSPPDWGFTLEEMPVQFGDGDAL